MRLLFANLCLRFREWWAVDAPTVTMKKAAWLVLVLSFAGCGHESATAAPTPVVRTVTATEQACQPFDVEWQIVQIDGSAPKYLIAPDNLGVDGVLLEERSGDPWQEFAGWKWGIEGLVMHFDMAYRVKAKVGNCWSGWYEFQTGPANGNYSGEATAPAHYTQTRCTQAKDFGAGQSEVLVFDAPAHTRVTATTYEINHAPGYQLGQAEAVMVSGFGETEDVGDLETAHSTSWSTPLPISEIRVTGLRGSLHGVSSAVCITVEGL